MAEEQSRITVIADHLQALQLICAHIAKVLHPSEENVKRFRELLESFPKEIVDWHQDCS